MSRLALSVAVTLSVLPLARAGDIFVPGDHATIQAAIDAAVGGDFIHVAAGTWLGPLSIPGKTLVIQGAGQEQTILDGGGAAQVVTGGAFNVVALRDLTVTGGVTGVTSPSGGINLERCTLRDLSGDGAQNVTSVTDCIVRDNGGDGIDGFYQVIRCSFTGNGGWGAMNVEGWGQVAAECSFSGNGLGGLRLAGASGSPLLQPTAKVAYCTFVGDTLQLSLAWPFGEAVAEVDFCSFHESSIKFLQGSVDASHVIARGPAAVQDLSAGGCYAEWSDIEGFTIPGVFECIQADPLWADAPNGDFRLLPGSPCINVGAPFYADPDGSLVEMGAVPYDAWTELGGGLAGSVGLARLSGFGAATPESELALDLIGATPAKPALLIVGLSEVNAPFKGGTLWPAPDVLVGPVPIDQLGALHLEGTWPIGLPSGFSFTTQMWWPDAAAIKGWASSNGVRGTQP